jgi:hypothetical protein
MAESIKCKLDAHLDRDPEQITWADVCDIGRIEGMLEELYDLHEIRITVPRARTISKHIRETMKEAKKKSRCACKRKNTNT